MIHVPDSPKRNAPPDLPIHFKPVFPNDDLVQAKVFSSSNVGNYFLGGTIVDPMVIGQCFDIILSYIFILLLFHPFTCVYLH